jgi:predicted O-methyltransferase YrrM
MKVIERESLNDRWKKAWGAQEEHQMIETDVVQMFPEDVESVMRLAGSLGNDITIVEVGVWTGHLTTHLGLHAKKTGSKVHAVDNWSGDGSLLDNNKVNNPKKMFINNMRKYNLLRTVKIHHGDSVDAASKFKDGSIDFLFLDADHRYSGVIRDLEAWFPKVKQGGIFAGHDYSGKVYFPESIEKDVENGIHNGVNKAVTEFFKIVAMFPMSVFTGYERN